MRHSVLLYALVVVCSAFQKRARASRRAHSYNAVSAFAAHDSLHDIGPEMMSIPENAELDHLALLGDFMEAMIEQDIGRALELSNTTFRQLSIGVLLFSIFITAMLRYFVD